MKKFLNVVSGISLVLAASFIFGQTPVFAQVTMPSATNSGASSTSSYNWSGYISQNSSNYTTVTGTWIVPTVSSSGNFAADAEWVGIGGVKSQDLIQTGTQTIVQNGSLTYQAWYELLPGLSQNVSLTINPGDSITASLNQISSSVWQISLRNNTSGQNFQTTINYNSSLSSAEWITEMPSQGNGGFIPLDNFNTIQFSNGSTTENGNTFNIVQSGAQTITMVNSQNQTLASASALTFDGGGFTVTRSSAAAASPITTIPFGRSGWGRVGRGSRGLTQITIPFPTNSNFPDQSFQNYQRSYRINLRLFSFGFFSK